MDMYETEDVQFNKIKRILCKVGRFINKLNE